MALEDFTVYDEIDTAGYIAVAAQTITVTDLETDVQASVGDDINAREGVQFGDTQGDFTWTLTMNAAPGSTGTGGKFFAPLVGTAHEDGGGQKTTGSGWNLKWDKFNGTKTPALGVDGGNTKINLTGTATSANTDYFLKFIFVDGTSTVTAEIYTDAQHTNLDSSASLGIGTDTGPFSWVMPCANENKGTIGNKDVTGTVKDFDMGFSAAAVLDERRFPRGVQRGVLRGVA